MNTQPSHNIPTVLIILGATGDLITKKIVPSLFHLFEKQKIPHLFQVMGFSRRDFVKEQFHEFISKVILQHQDSQLTKKKLFSFLELFSYQRGSFESKQDYINLAKVLGQIDGEWRVCSNKLFYIATPPKFYETIFKNLAASSLTKPCSLEEGWTRVIVEKPFGKDLKTAQQLEKLLGKLFKEIQIYRIDHYLAKEMLQNILAFRFSNNLLEKSWSNESIEKIEIKLWETIGVEGRGSFYDGIGALRDVGQNHLLQMLAWVSMEHPVNFESEIIRLKRAQILKTIMKPSSEEIRKFTFRAQYKGYQDIQGVNSNSQTETYFKARAFLESSRWWGVPIILESGKRLKEQIKEIIVTFKHPIPCLCPPGITEHYKNKIVFRLEPKEEITLHFWSKKPGLQFEIEERDFNFIFRGEDKKPQYTEEYEKLLLDCIIGDQTLFVSAEEVKAMWRFIDPIIRAWQNNAVPLKAYRPNTNQAVEQSKYIEEISITPQMKLK